MLLQHLSVIILIIILTIFTAIYSEQIIQYFQSWTYIGIFFLALLSSASLFIPLAPMQLAIVFLSLKLNPIYCAILAGIGSAIGESTGYFFGKELEDIVKESKDLKKNKIIKAIYQLQKNFLEKHTAAAIFILSFFPNPIFDIVGLYAGVKKVNYLHYLLLTSAGRILRFYILIQIGLGLNGLIGFV
ncbi:MAG: VTT domain-containing protein [Candidatus Micrarchaeota archaeon]|nr:VTT domain-containing protein [Candidatus Micrarchaeota archaeon]